MDPDDEGNPPNNLSSNVMTATIAPNHFHLSIYKENHRPNIENHFSPFHVNLHEPMRTSMATYKCCLCRKFSDGAMVTCAKCVNTGRFCPSKHDTCSSKRRQALVNMLNRADQEEFQQYSNKLSINSPAHLQCSDRMFLLKKFNREKNNLQAEYEKKIESTIRLTKLTEEISIRKNRLKLIHQSLQRLEEKNNHDRFINFDIEKRNEKHRSRIQLMISKITEMKMVINSSNNEIRKKNDLRIEQENKLYSIRRQRLNEVYKYIFPIDFVSFMAEDLASTMRALSSAQQSIVDGTNSDMSENEETIGMGGNRYQIVNSYLPVNGDYQIEKLLLTLDVDGKSADIDSLQSTLSKELYEVLSSLSHACQLMNVIAFYLHITLPFRLHQLEFNGDNLTTDRLRADIAKLNANIFSSCLSQGMPMDLPNFTHTLENLRNLLAFKRYPSRPKPVLYSQQYIDMMEEEVNEISRAYVTDYWFDDVEKDVTDLLNSDEWETVPQDYNIPEDPSTQDHLGSLRSSPGQTTQQHPQHPSIMIGSIGYLRNKGSTLISSVFRSLAK